MLDIKSFLIDGIGLWSELRPSAPARSASVLLLDRDGVVNEDTGYVGDAAGVSVLPGVAKAVARCNRANIPVAIVTNQSGIGRGLYGWEEFARVQRAIDKTLAIDGAHIDAVFACAYHQAGIDSFSRDHRWRKPYPGMLLAALQSFDGSPRKSAMVGDKASDMEAAVAAAIDQRFLISGEVTAAPSGGATIVPDLEEAVGRFLNCIRRSQP